MKTILLNFVAVTLLSTLVTTVNTRAAIPAPPQPNEGMYAIELFRVETPLAFNETHFLRKNISIDWLFSHEANRIQAYPVMYSVVGMAAVYDNTKTEMLAADFKLVDGKAVPINKACELGVKAEVTILNMKRSVATYTLSFSYCDLKGFIEYTLADDVKCSLPEFETRRINTELSQLLGSWLVLGGFSSPKGGGIQSTYYLIRITQPIIISLP